MRRINLRLSGALAAATLVATGTLLSSCAEQYVDWVTVGPAECVTAVRAFDSKSDSAKVYTVLETVPRDALPTVRVNYIIRLVDAARAPVADRKVVLSIRSKLTNQYLMSEVFSTDKDGILSFASEGTKELQIKGQYWGQSYSSSSGGGSGVGVLLGPIGLAAGGGSSTGTSSGWGGFSISAKEITSPIILRGEYEEILEVVNTDNSTTTAPVKATKVLAHETTNMVHQTRAFDVIWAQSGLNYVTSYSTGSVKGIGNMATRKGNLPAAGTGFDTGFALLGEGKAFSCADTKAMLDTYRGELRDRWSNESDVDVKYRGLNGALTSCEEVAKEFHSETCSSLYIRNVYATYQL